VANTAPRTPLLHHTQQHNSHASAHVSATLFYTLTPRRSLLLDSHGKAAGSRNDAYETVLRSTVHSRRAVERTDDDASPLHRGVDTAVRCTALHRSSTIQHIERLVELVQIGSAGESCPAGARRTRERPLVLAHVSLLLPFRPHTSTPLLTLKQNPLTVTVDAQIAVRRDANLNWLQGDDTSVAPPARVSILFRSLRLRSCCVAPRPA
jgi:hypothetical protein